MGSKLESKIRDQIKEMVRSEIPTEKAEIQDCTALLINLRIETEAYKVFDTSMEEIKTIDERLREAVETLFEALTPVCDSDSEASEPPAFTGPRSRASEDATRSAASPAQEARGPVRGRKRSSTQYKQSVSEAARSAPGAGEKAAASSRSPSRSRSNAGSAASQQPQGRSSTSPSQGANEELTEAAYRKSSAATSDISGQPRERSSTSPAQGQRLSSKVVSGPPQEKCYE